VVSTDIAKSSTLGKRAYTPKYGYILACQSLCLAFRINFDARLDHISMTRQLISLGMMEQLPSPDAHRSMFANGAVGSSSIKERMVLLEVPLLNKACAIPILL
jgi:hypothetical protein